jgi:hypothetical protein
MPTVRLASVGGTTCGGSPPSRAMAARLDGPTDGEAGRRSKAAGADQEGRPASHTLRRRAACGIRHGFAFTL